MREQNGDSSQDEVDLSYKHVDTKMMRLKWIHGIGVPLRGFNEVKE